MRAGALLAAVAVLLAALGIVIVWTSQSDSNEPGDISADSIGEFCPLVDTAPLAELVPVEEERSERSEPKATPPQFGCEVTLLGDEESTQYQVVTLIADFRVESTIGAAREAYSGAIDFEESQGRVVTATGTKAEEAAFVTVSETTDLQQYRAHLHDSNAVGSVSLVVSGSGMSAEDAQHILITIGEDALAVMGSE